MKFKDLEWKDIVSDNVIVSSHCMLKLNFRLTMIRKIISIICMRLEKEASGDYSLKNVDQLNQLGMLHTGYIQMRWNG